MPKRMGRPYGWTQGGSIELTWRLVAKGPPLKARLVLDRVLRRIKRKPEIAFKYAYITRNGKKPVEPKWPRANRAVLTKKDLDPGESAGDVRFEFKTKIEAKKWSNAIVEALKLAQACAGGWSIHGEIENFVNAFGSDFGVDGVRSLAWFLREKLGREHRRAKLKKCFVLARAADK